MIEVMKKYGLTAAKKSRMMVISIKHLTNTGSRASLCSRVKPLHDINGANSALFCLTRPTCRKEKRKMHLETCHIARAGFICKREMIWLISHNKINAAIPLLNTYKNLELSPKRLPDPFSQFTPRHTQHSFIESMASSLTQMTISCQSDRPFLRRVSAHCDRSSTCPAPHSYIMINSLKGRATLIKAEQGINRLFVGRRVLLVGSNKFLKKTEKSMKAKDLLGNHIDPAIACLTEIKKSRNNQKNTWFYDIIRYIIIYKIWVKSKI